MSTQPKESIEDANVEFYRAVETSNIIRMEDVWAHETWVSCIHPGWNIITGWQRVRESWERIFESGQKLRISPLDVKIHTEGDFAWVVCTENITVFEESNFDSAQTVATNLFTRRDGLWLLVHHHASSVPIIVPDHSSDIIQ